MGPGVWACQTSGVLKNVEDVVINGVMLDWLLGGCLTGGDVSRVLHRARLWCVAWSKSAHRCGNSFQRVTMLNLTADRLHEMDFSQGRKATGAHGVHRVDRRNWSSTKQTKRCAGRHCLGGWRAARGLRDWLVSICKDEVRYRVLNNTDPSPRGNIVATWW